MPGQTIEEMVDTIIYLMGKKVLIGPSIYYPTPGTPLFERCKSEGILPSHFCQWRSSAFPIETATFNRLDMVTLFRLARLINFIKGKMDERVLDESMTWKELYRVLKERAKAKEIVWKDLLLMISEDRSFFSLRKDSGGRISISRIESSKKVLDCFFERSWQKSILGSCHSFI
jgi:hypothetical protein